MGHLRDPNGPARSVQLQERSPCTRSIIYHKQKNGKKKSDLHPQLFRFISMLKVIKGSNFETLRVGARLGSNSQFQSLKQWSMWSRYPRQ